METGVTASEHRASSQRRIPWQGQLLLLAFIWGSGFLLIKVSVEGFSPTLLTFVRLVLASATLLVVMRLRHDRLPRGFRVWLHLAVAGLLLNVLPYVLYAYGETHITSILAGIWNATVPLLTVLVVMISLPEERPTVDRILGLLVGFAGVLVVLGFWQGLVGGALLGSLACLVGSATEGIGFPYTRKYLTGRNDTVLALAVGQLLCAAAEMLPLLPFFGGVAHTVPVQSIISLLCLGFLNTGVAYILTYGLVRDVGATMMSTVTYLMPLVAAVEGVLILREPITWNEPIGGLIVIAGIAISERGMAWIGRAAGAAGMDSPVP